MPHPATIAIRIPETAANYPPALRRCGQDSVSHIGNLSALDKTLIGFFCSVRAPGDAILKTYDFARAIRDSNITIMGGFHSPMEKEFLDLLLRGSVNVVICPARGLDRFRLAQNWKTPIAEGRLLILSFFEDKTRSITAATAARRNAHIAAIADKILITHADKGGKTEALCTDALATGKPVFTLESPDNAHLVGLGAVGVSPCNFSKLSQNL